MSCAVGGVSALGQFLEDVSTASCTLCLSFCSVKWNKHPSKDSLGKFDIL